MKTTGVPAAPSLRPRLRLAGHRREHGTAGMLVTHDMGVIAETADRVAVMYAGRIVEVGPVQQVIHQPQHPYTAGLLAAQPHPDPDKRRTQVELMGEVPSMAHRPPGCEFHTRCPWAQDLCRQTRPEVRLVAPDHSHRCHFPLKTGSA